MVALNDVSFSCRRGCVQALVGENGAGKSTLMKVMSGAYQPDSGTITIRGRSGRSLTPVEAQKLGISIIYQEFNLVPYLSVAENIFIGREPHTPLGLLDGRAMRRMARDILKELNLNIDVDAWARELPVAQQQMVEIAKALSLEADIIVMDEPTAASGRRRGEHPVRHRSPAEKHGAVHRLHLAPIEGSLPDRRHDHRHARRTGDGRQKCGGNQYSRNHEPNGGA